MPTFASLEDLRSSLWQARLGRLAEPIVATARPDLMFWRKSSPDDELPPGIGKIGGRPDLPASFEWPWREPFADAEARERAGRSLLDSFDRDVLDHIEERDIGRFAFFHRRFPLAFVGQIDLALMALEPGFDDRLPDTGLLSVFYDLTDGYGGSPRLYWHDVPRHDLVPRVAPRELVDYYDTYGSHEMGDDGPVWAGLTHADTLHPVSGLSVPQHWRDAGTGGSADALDEWFDNEPGAIGMTDAPAGHLYYGDHLGGWPTPIQHHPETEIDNKGITTPGDTRWRHILSLNVGECMAETRLMALDCRSDGQHYIFMDEDDLAARRFERAQSVHQMT